MKKIAIMQPYFFPYIGYFQLVSCVDVFVIYDNIKFTKKGWINRNRILHNNSDRLFTLPVKKDSNYLNVNQRYISETAIKENEQTLRLIELSYKKAPYFSQVFPIVKECFLHNNKNLFDFIFNSLKQTNDYLGIETKIIKSSNIDIDHSLKAQEKVIAICVQLGADTYINSIGGTELYSYEDFSANGIALEFIKTNKIKYDQFGGDFIPNLSIIDVMMFNSIESIKKMLGMYELI